MNFLAGEGWRDFTGYWTVGWPPLFPLLLAALGWVGIEPIEGGRLVNATAFGLTILAAGLYLRSHLRSQGLTLVATVALLASLPLSHWAACIMTESLFVLLTLLALIQLATFLHRKTDAPLYWAAVFAALAALTRYPGVALIGTGVLVLLVRRAVPPAARFKHTLVFGAISSIPLLAVLVRNWAAKGDLAQATGYREALSGQSLSDGLSRVADVFRGWVIPPNAPDGLAYLLSIAAGLVVLAAGVVVVLSGRSVGMGGQKETDRTASPFFGLELALPFGGFAAIYLVFTVGIVPLVVPIEFPVRYLLPIYVPLLLAAVFLLDRFLSIKAAGRRGAAKWCLVSLVLLATLAHIGYSAHENLRITDKAWRDGFITWASNGSYWESSELRNYTQTNFSSDDWIYSNVPTLVWFWNRTAAIGKYRPLPRKIQNLTSAILQGSDGDSPYILWHRRKEPFYDYDDFDLRLLPGVDTVAELSDGGVFRVTTTEPSDAERHHARNGPSARKQRYVQQLIQQASEHVARADWTVYRTGRTLTYRKEPCTSADMQAKFVLHVIPTDPADLPADRQQYGFDNLDFYFNQLGFQLDDQCIAIVRLPDYAINHIRVGQWIAKENRTLWGAELLEIGG